MMLLIIVYTNFFQHNSPPSQFKLYFILTIMGYIFASFPFFGQELTDAVSTCNISF
nr:unnamed protein product [Callosobruchus chinensis]